MILIIKKNAILMMLMLLVVGYISYIAAEYDAKPTFVLPVTNKVIVLDAGHGGRDPGAVSKSGVSEKEINLDIVLKLQALLEQSGCIIQLTRAVDESLHSSDSERTRTRKMSDLKARKEIINSSDADAYVSIHLNHFPEEKYKGVQSFYSIENERGKSLAGCIQKELKSSLQINDNREALPISDVFLMKNSKVPSVIVECGFLSNSEEEKKLTDEKYREKIAWGVYIGIMKHFEE